jgi:hypothetical protein
LPATVGAPLTSGEQDSQAAKPLVTTKARRLTLAGFGVDNINSCSGTNPTYTLKRLKFIARCTIRISGKTSDRFGGLAEKDGKF